jgi:exonuclease III
MRILCLNVQSGAGSRWRGILDFVAGHSPDVVVFTEWRRGASPTPAEAWVRERDMTWFAACEGSTLNGVAVAAKTPFCCEGVTPDRQSPGTLLQADFPDWSMLASYFPQGEAKNRYFDVVRRLADARGDRPFLVMGDLNTGNQLADKTAAGAKYACAERFDRLSSADGLVDLWRATHGAEAREWSWTTSKNGFRLDHAFGNSAFVKAFDPTCVYDHSTREAKLSDHSALIVSSVSN